MSADLLREAAKVLKEHAEKATPGPWKYGQALEGEYLEGSGSSCDDDERAMLYLHYAEDVGTPLGAADGEYIALMHPPVALAVVDLLDALAVSVASNEFDGRSSVVLVPGYSRACALARAILRRSE